MRRLLFVLGFAALFIASLSAEAMQCDLNGYKRAAGLTATASGDVLTLEWAGAQQEQLRAAFHIVDGEPTIAELAVRRGAGWTALGRELAPEFEVTSGVRRMSLQQADPLEEMGVKITDEVIEKNKWYAFWDAPLRVPGITQGRRPRNFGLPRRADEIRRARAKFQTRSCAVKTNGARLELTFDGLEMGIFAGQLRFTVYRSTNLLRMEAIAKTEEPSVAYKYDGGLRGFTTATLARVLWRDTAGHEQGQSFGGAKNESIAPVRAANRLLVAGGDAGAIAVFPPPHTFFFAREVETNLGYVWYRNDGEGRYAIGVRQADHEDTPEYAENFALYNAPPGTWQHMAVYFYVSAQPAESTREAALHFTRNDHFAPVPGYQVFANHFHLGFTQRLRDSGSLDTPLQDDVAMKAVGINLVGNSDFHELESALTMDTGPQRFPAQRDYFEGSRRASDSGFLMLPWEEPSVWLGGHWNVLWPKPFYWSKKRAPGDPFIEQNAQFGKVYHAGSKEEAAQIIEDEKGYWYTSHPRTKGSTGYPDAFIDAPYVRNDRYLGIAFKPAMGMDLSEARLCEWRCFDALDMLNNHFSNSGLLPKLLIADVDTYRKGPEDDLYANFPVNYIKLARVPRPDEDWTPILATIRAGNLFVTTGEILIPNYEWQGTGVKRTLVADMEWTFPLEFVELVWGDGKRVDRQVISATDLPAFGRKRFTVPFDATGKTWVRFAAWDSAGNGAFLEPVWVNR